VDDDDDGGGDDDDNNNNNFCKCKSDSSLSVILTSLQSRNICLLPFIRYFLYSGEGAHKYKRSDISLPFF